MLVQNLNVLCVTSQIIGDQILFLSFVVVIINYMQLISEFFVLSTFLTSRNVLKLNKNIILKTR